MTKHIFNPELDGKGKVVSSVREKFKPKTFAVGNQIAKAFETVQQKPLKNMNKSTSNADYKVSAEPIITVDSGHSSTTAIVTLHITNSDKIMEDSFYICGAYDTTTLEVGCVISYKNPNWLMDDTIIVENDPTKNTIQLKSVKSETCFNESRRWLSRAIDLKEAVIKPKV